MVKFAGIGTGGDNVPIVGEKPQLSPSYFLNIIPCLAGCITGGAVCNYLTNTRKQETLNAIFEINDKGKKFKVVKVRQKEDQNDDRVAYEELKDEDKEEFNNHKDIYGSGFSGWWNYLWKKEPIYKIVEVPEELDEKPINDQIIKNPEKSGIEFNQKLLKIDDRYDINYISNEKKQYDELSPMHPDDHAIRYTSTNFPVLSAKELAELIKNKKNNIDNDVIFAFFERIKDLKTEDMEVLLKGNGSGNIFQFILKIFDNAGVEQIPQNLRIVILNKIIANPKAFFLPDKEQEDSEDIKNNKNEDDIDNNHEEEFNEARISIFLKLLPYCVEDLNFENLKDIDKNALNKLFFIMVGLFNKGKIDLNNDNNVNYQNEQSLFIFFSKLLQHYVDRADELPKFDGEDADNDERKFYENLLLLTIRCYNKKQKLPAVGECDQENFNHFIELILSKVKDLSFLQKEQRDKLFILIFKTYKEGEKLPSLEDDEEEEKKEEEREEKEEEIEEREKLKKPNKKRDELFIQLFKGCIRDGCLPDEFWQILTDFLISFIEHQQPIPKEFMTMLSVIFNKNIECKFSKDFWDLFIEHIEKNIHQIPDDWKKIITKTQTVDEGVQKDDEGNQVKERQLKKENVYKFVIKQPDKSKDKKNPKNLSIDKKSGGRFTYKSTGGGGKMGRGSKSNFSNLGISTLVPIEKNTLYKRLDGHSNVQTLVVKNKDNRFVDDVQGFEGYDIINSNGVKKNLDTNNEPNINKTQYGKKYKLVFGNEKAKKQNEALNDERKPHIRRETTVYSGYRKEFCNNESASYFNNIYKNNKKTLHGNNTGT